MIINQDFEALFTMAERGKVKAQQLRQPAACDQTDIEIAWQDNAQREVIPSELWPYLVALDHKVDEESQATTAVREVRIPGAIYYLVRIIRRSGRWVRLGEAEPGLFSTFMVPRACPGICAPDASDGPRWIDWQDWVYKGNDPDLALYHAQIEGAYVQKYQNDYGEMISKIITAGK